MCGTKMVAEGLPLNRRERGTDEDVLSGADFLSVLLRTSYYESYTEATSHSTTAPPVTLQPTTLDVRENYIRHSRSTPHLPTIPQSSSEEQTNFDYTSAKLQNIEGDNINISTQSSDLSLDNGVIVAVRVSSSVDRKEYDSVNQRQEESSDSMKNENFETTPVLLAEYEEPNAVASEERPSIVVDVSNSGLTVDEGEPITTNRDLAPAEFGSNSNINFPANVRPLTNVPMSPNFSEKLKPFHETVIFHDNPREPNRGRSVSYSAVIQALPHVGSGRDPWSEEKTKLLDRHERHYDDTQSPNNDFARETMKQKLNHSRDSPAVAETNHFFITSNPEKDQHIEKNWEAPEVYAPDVSTSKPTITTEKNWEMNEKSYTPNPHLPKVYAQPEQNYEVDESVSVVSNGRVHGIQPSQPQNTPKPETRLPQSPSKKPDDNQKVGYVVEGRNYRKYRVEERTSDGFIVGEYGVVSHDDGSLRGVRYTADGTINPRLIYDALMKFLSL